MTYNISESIIYAGAIMEALREEFGEDAVTATKPVPDCDAVHIEVRIPGLPGEDDAAYFRYAGKIAKEARLKAERAFVFGPLVEKSYAGEAPLSVEVKAPSPQMLLIHLQQAMDDARALLAERAAASADSQERSAEETFDPTLHSFPTIRGVEPVITTENTPEGSTMRVKYFKPWHRTKPPEGSDD